MSVDNSAHPWRSTQAGTNQVWSVPPEEGYQTSAYWHGGALHPLGNGRPYADFIEFTARCEGKLYGKWTGTFCPAEFRATLEAMGAL